MALTKKQRDFAKHTKKQFFEGGKEEGKAETKTEIAKNMIALGFDDKTIIEVTGLSESEIEELRKA